MVEVVAVTGADGFIGSHLVEGLVARGHTVKAMAQYNSFGSYGWIDTLPADVLAQVQIYAGDVRDRNSVMGLMDGAAVVYHLAALIAVPYSYRAPQSYVDTNVAGTLNVLESARLLGTPRVVHTSTSETYGTACAVPIAEDHPLRAQSPYAATKIAADKLVESYHHSFGLPTVTVRPFNTYGPRQSTRAIIPTIITQLAERRQCISLGSLTPSRDFLFVADTVSAFLAVGHATNTDLDGTVLNVGTGAETTIDDLARTIAKIMNMPLDITSHEERKRPEASEVERLVCDASELRRRTGWRPEYDLKAGLTVAVDWFLEPANLSRYRSDRYL